MRRQLEKVLSKIEDQPCVFVVDDDIDIRRIVVAALSDAKWTARAYASAVEFLNDYHISRRGCLLLDINLPDLSGPQLQKELLARRIELPIVFLTAETDVLTAVDLMKHGAVDLLKKPLDLDVLLQCVERAVASDAARWDLQQRRMELEGRLSLLTPRERQVLDLVVAGHASKTIAMDLGLSEKTVEVHRGRLMKKMNAANVADLVRQSTR